MDPQFSTPFNLTSGRVVSAENRQPPDTAHYFVDEAGDLALFDKRGRPVIGQVGVSHTFMVGIAEITDPGGVARGLDALRAELLADPYFSGVPSMRPEARKTALAFHAKDDVPEVRREVFRYLRTISARVFVGIRRKAPLIAEYRAAYGRTAEKYSSDAIYDGLVSELFTGRLHQASENHIIFARRGKSSRNRALEGAIRDAKLRFEAKWKKGIDRPTVVSSSVPSETTCLQAIDYYLWALQRMVELREDRYFQLLASAFRLVIDRDDTRVAGYGAYYSARNPLSLEKLMPVL